MSRHRSIHVALRAAVAAASGALVFAGQASAEFAGAVQSYSQGTVAFANPASTYNNSLAAVGEPNRIEGVSIGFPSPVTPFNPPFEESEIVDVGRGGQITLALPVPVPATPGSLQVGVFTSAGLNDPSFTGHAEATARTFAGAEFGADRTAVVEVASTLGNFISLGRMVFTQPTQGFANQSDPFAFPTPPVPSNFDQPFAGDLASFNGKSQPEITTLLQGSGGGTWIDLTPEAAAQLGGPINFVRISDPLWQVIGTGALETTRRSVFNPNGPDNPFDKPADLFIDGVNVVPEPASLGVLAAGALALACGRRRRRA